MSVSPAHGRASNKYNAAHYEGLRVQVVKGRREQIKAQAATEGKSLNQYVLDAIDEHEQRKAGN